MPIFDANAYFAAKAAQGNLTDKFSALEAASAAKTQALEEHRLVSQQRAEKKALEQAAVDASWSGQLDLESGGFLGNRVNEAASLVSGASRLAGHITSLAPNALSYMDTAPTTAADTEAWNRTKVGKALPEDSALLDRPIGPNSTVRKSFEDAEAHRAAGRKVNDFFNLEKIVDPTHRNALTADLKDAFEEPWAQLSTGVNAIGDGDVLSGSANAVAGLAKLLFNTGDAVISNPTGVKEFVIENAPQFFVGAFGAPGKAAMLASNAGYAADTYQQGIENYAKANGGALPPEAERQSMARKAASLALAEQAGDMIGLSAAKLGRKAFGESADSIKSSFKESLKNIGKAGGKGLVAESPTEGYQTYMEGEITGKPTTAADIYTGAVIGGIAGATLSGGGRAVAEVMGATPEKAEERQQEATQKQALQAAVTSGDVSAYVDPAKGTYAPEKAVAALYGNSQLPDATPETKQANYEKAVNVVEELQDRRASIALIIEEETALEAEGKKSSKKLYEAQLSKTDRQLDAAQESLNAFKMQMQPAVEEDEASITAMKQGDVEATDRMINLSMAIPERLSAAAASELAESSDTQLTEPQRTYLRAFSEARVAENMLKGMGGVSEEIYTGSDKNVGIAQYRSRMADAVLAGNQKMADRQLKDLTSFVLDHQNKAQVAQEALDMFRETGKQVQLLSDGKGGWNINQGKQLSRKEVSANGGMTIHQGTPESLITNIALEAKALSTAAAELDAAYAMKFAEAKPVAAKVEPVAPKPTNPAKSELEQRIDRYTDDLKNQANTSTEKLTKVAAWAAKKLAEIAEARKAKNLSADRIVQLVGYTSKLESFAKSVNDVLVKRNKGGIEPAAAPAVTPTPPKPAPAIDAPTSVQPEATVPNKVERRDSITRESVRAEPETLFVFGDNDQRKGNGGQAKAMRGEPNAVGIRTKDAPHTGESAYWSDAMYEDNIKKIDEDFKRIESHKGTVVIPSAGLGTGLSELQIRAPKTLAYLESKIAALTPTASTQVTPTTSSEPVVVEPAEGQNPPKNTTAPEGATATTEEPTTDYGEIAKLLKKAEKAYRSATRKNPRSLWTALKHSLNEADLSDIYGNEWRKRFTMLKGKQGRSLVDMVADGTLDDFLPFNLRFGMVGLEQDGTKETEAEEFIKEKLRNRDYLTQETKDLLQQIDLTIQSLENTLSLKDIQDAIETTEAELQSQQGRTATKAVTATTEEPAGSTAQPSGEEATGSGSTAPVVESGALTALAQKSPEGTPYQSRNLLADHLTQSAGRDDGTALRPLVAVKDFMKALANKTVRISDYLEEKARNLSDEQKDFIRLFNAKVREWAPVIQQNLVKGYWNNTEKKVVPNTGFEYRDLMQHLIQGTTETGLDLEENIKTALVYGAMRVVADSAEDGIFNSPQTINRMMQRDKDALVSETEQLLLGSVGLRENLWRNSVGQAAVSALGFKPNEDAPMDLLPRLESIFGAHIEKLLMDADILQRTTLTMAEMEELFPTENQAEGEKVVPWKMLKLVRNKEGVLSPEANQIAEASKDTKNILDKLFGVAPKLTFPSLEPLPFKQAKAGGVDEGVPSLFVEVLNENQAEENFLRDDVWMVMSTIPEEDFLEMAGMVDPETNVIHAAELLSVKAKNEGLAREYRNLNTFGGDLMALGEGELGDVPYYTSHDVWQTQRVGISDNGFNPQASKMHRGMYYKKDWKQTIELSDGAALDNFKVVVAESFGVKTDIESNQTTLDAFEGMVDPERAASEKGKAKASKLQAAIKVLQKIIYEGSEATPEDVQTLKDGVKAGGEKLQSLAALTDMAHLYQAQQTGATSFVTHLQAETDGKTNGIILSQLLFGGADSIEDMKTRMHRGGISFQGDEHTQFNLWKAGTGSLDQYESLTQRMVRIAQGMVYWAPKLFAAVEAFTKPLELEGRIEKAGRDLTKNPLTTLMFGAKLYSAVDKMADKVIADIYKRIVEVKTGETQTPITEILENLNTLLLAGDSFPVDSDMSVDEALRLQLSPEQIKAIKKAFHLSLGAAAKQAISEDFDAYLSNRAVLDDAAKLVFEMSDAITKAMREDYIQELIDADLMPTRNGVPIRALSRKEEKEFKRRTNKLAPRVHTVGSLRDGKLSNGVSLATSENVLSQDPVFQGNAAFGTPFKDTVGRKDKNGKSREAFRVDLNSNQRVQKAPRTGPAAKLVHSLDSATSHDAQLGRQVQNNHDALVSGVVDAKGTAEALNKALFNNLVAYSPLTEMLNSLTGMIQQITEVAMDSENQTLSDQAKSNLAEVLNEYGFGSVSPVEGLTQRIKNLANTAYEADKMKLTVLAEAISVDQYTREGGNYLTTPKDREAVQQKLNDLSPEVPLEAYEALDSLASMLGNLLNKPRKKAEVVEETGPFYAAPTALEFAEEKRRLVQYAREQARGLKPDPALLKNTRKQISNPNRTPFGALGESDIASDKGFVAELEKRKQLTTKQIVYMLRKRFVPNTFNREILEKLVPLINPDLKIVYIEKGSAKLDDASMPAMPSRGWYITTKEGAETIYVLGTEYRDSGVTPELFLHELLHAALAQLLRNPSKEAAPLIAELEALLAEAANVVKQDPTLSAFAPAVSSIDELISWGITNQDFQVKVLSKVRMPSKNKGNRLISGMKAFVETVAALLFRNPTTKQNHGLMVLVQNVSGLIASAEQAKPKVAVNQSMAAVNAIDSFTTHDIFTALNTPDVDVAFRGHLSNLLGGIVEKLHGPYGSFKESFMKNTASNPLDVWLKALDTGVAPFASQALVSGFTITPQEAFVMEQVEATMQAALDNGALTKVAYRELSDLYTEVRAKLKVQDFHDGDWATASTDEQAKAKALHDFVFKIEKNNGDKSNYLARFAALGLAHQGFNKLLQVATNRDTRRLTDAKGFAERIQMLFEKVLAYFNGMMTHTYAGQPADTKLAMLVNNLVGIEAKKRHNLKRQATSFNSMAPVENGVKKLTEGARAKMGELAGSNFVRNSSQGLVRGAGALARTVAGDRVEIYLEGLARLRNKEFKGRQGVVAGLLNDVRGPKELFNALLRESKNHERIRKNTITSTSKVVLQAFANDGKDLSKKAKEAISAVFLRTGTHVLTMPELDQVLNSTSELQKSIVDTEKQLDTFAKFKPYFIKQANALAYYKATGKVKGDMVLMNAHNIARMYGTPYAARMTQQQATQAEAMVDKLVTLYALEYLGSSQLAQAANVLRTENQRTDGNGVEFVLKLHKRLEEESNTRLFAGRKTLMMKGYAPEIYNPHTEIQVANEEGGKELVKLGYVRGSSLERDNADPAAETQHFYVLKDGGLQPHLTGIIAYDGKKAKGTKKHNGYMNVNTDAGLANASLQASITGAKQKAVQQLFKNEPRKDLSKVQGAFMAPVLNDKGEVVNWRYLMAEATKDTLLERDNRFEKILGVLAGSIYSKETTQEQNQKVVSALKEDYDNNHTDNNDAYVLVGPKSTDKEFREIWNLLPEDTKAEVRKVWGFDGMYVRSDSLDITFGYRKLSLSQIFDKDPEARNQFEKLFAAVIQWNLTLYARTKLGMNQQDAEDYAQRARVVVTRGERIWQELVAETKDIIVVKTGLVMIGNITSNLSLLTVAGVSMKDILQSHLVAMKGATSYQNDSEELHRYKMLLETGYTQGNEEEIHNNILRLEDAIARNPVKGLIDAGLMPTIVEDVSADEDLYSYKSAFARKTERFTNKLNDKVVSAGKLVYMTHDTKAYQLLSRTTQLSDFVARYTLYQHLTTRKENPLSHEAAIQEASDAFVNYDIPMHRGMQYTDDMGFTMFTKYFLRIQRVLLKLGRENPARMLMLALLNNYMDLMPHVLESSALAHMGNNPLRSGAFQFPGSLDDLATVNSAMSLLK